MPQKRQDLLSISSPDVPNSQHPPTFPTSSARLSSTFFRGPSSLPPPTLPRYSPLSSDNLPRFATLPILTFSFLFMFPLQDCHFCGTHVLWATHTIPAYLHVCVDGAWPVWCAVCVQLIIVYWIDQYFLSPKNSPHSVSSLHFFNKRDKRPILIKIISF